MRGPPKDVDGECNARLILGDDYGDGTCTIRCQLPSKHEGPHTETFKRKRKPVTITWHHDETKDR